MLPVEFCPHAKKRFCAIHVLQRGRPNVVTPQVQRSPALCSCKVAEVVDPNQMLGNSLGVEAPDPSTTRRQAAQALREMAEQAKRMVRDSLLTQMRREWATVAPAVAAMLVLMEVSVQDDHDRMNVDTQAVLQVFLKRIPS